jgi:hypothetical protein
MLSIHKKPSGQIDNPEGHSIKRSWAWWHTPVIPALGMLRQAGLQNETLSQKEKKVKEKEVSVGLYSFKRSRS